MCTFRNELLEIFLKHEVAVFYCSVLKLCFKTPGSFFPKEEKEKETDMFQNEFSFGNINAESGPNFGNVHYVAICQMSICEQIRGRSGRPALAPYRRSRGARFTADLALA